MRWVVTIVALLAVLLNSPISQGYAAAGPGAAIEQAGAPAISPTSVADRDCDGCDLVAGFSTDCTSSPCTAKGFASVMAQKIPLASAQAINWSIFASAMLGVTQRPESPPPKV